MTEIYMVGMFVFIACVLNAAVGAYFTWRKYR